MEHQFKVEQLKTRLDKYLAEQLAGVSRSQIQRDIEAGLVLVNGKKVSESKFVVRLNDIVKYQESGIKDQENIIQATNTPLKVLYNNHGLIIIDKPAGMVVHPGAGFKGETLASALLYEFKDIHLVGEEHRPGIVHRLDKDTSGVILVAANSDMYEHLKNAFAERKVKKEYIALVWGRVEKQQGVIDAPIGKSKTDFRKMAAKEPVDAKEALTEYKVLEYLKNPSTLDEYTLIRVKLHTGRTHQIRVHMSYIGHPLLGDSLYGGKRANFKGLNRQFLHAKKIEVRLPDGTWIEAESELAEDLKDILINLNSKVVTSL
ncbi:MAG: RluA family pseudouridine synthase [Candidatus Doudnabacteria bacterium]|nr:RluA family pseudouridine synthase [Candidatus Doudnabacteria bacterium]